MAYPNNIGNKRYWTRERVLAALTSALQEIEGPLPISDRTWHRMKRGRYDWPGCNRIWEFFRSMAWAWLAVGAPRQRVSLHNVSWTKEEDEYLLEHAGHRTLKDIGFHLGRSYSSVRFRLNRTYRTHARHNQGYLSAAELSKEYGCPYHRVRIALLEGRIKGRFDRRRNRWQVDPVNLTGEALAILRRPKLHSYRTYPPDLGDYYKRHGLRRRRVEGRVVVVPV